MFLHVRLRPLCSGRQFGAGADKQNQGPYLRCVPFLFMLFIRPGSARDNRNVLIKRSYIYCNADLPVTSLQDIENNRIPSIKSNPKWALNSIMLSAAP